jgi:hypothetical protein
MGYVQPITGGRVEGLAPVANAVGRRASVIIVKAAELKADGDQIASRDDNLTHMPCGSPHKRILRWSRKLPSHADSGVC